MKNEKLKIKNFSKELILLVAFLLTLPLITFGIGRLRSLSSQAASSTFKVTRNHQLTCAEQPDWGNIITVKVFDENGNPLPNTQVEYWPDCPYHSRDPNKTPPPAGVLTTDAGGQATFNNLWPGCLPCLEETAPCTAGDHRINFFFKVKGARSDTAVEISSGIYGNECSSPFCPGRSTVNVWGHWGYEIIFRRTPGDLVEEEIPTDHAGQLAGCSFWHFYAPYQDYNPHRSGSAPAPTSTPGPSLPTATPPPGQPTPTNPPAGDCPCEVWGKNICDGLGYGSYDVLAGTFNTLAECQGFAGPFSYTCNCDEVCTTGSGHDANQICTSGRPENIANGKSTCSCNEFQVKVVNPALCGASASACTCEKMDVSGIIAKGQTIQLVTYATVKDASRQVSNIIYHVERNGTEISKSDPVTAVGPDNNRYYAAWTWTIPNTAGSADYKIRAEIICGSKTAAAVAFIRKEGFFASLLRSLANLFGQAGVLSGFNPAPPPPAPSEIVFAPKNARTLQLGTFISSTVTSFEKDCLWVRFKLN
jgi:hypothetical protein